MSTQMSCQYSGESSRYLSYCYEATPHLQYALNISYTPHTQQTISKIFLIAIFHGDVPQSEELWFQECSSFVCFSYSNI